MIMIRIRLNPGTSQERCWRDPHHGIVCSVKASPIDGKANAALIAYCSTRIGVAKSAITITSGFTTRYKMLAIETKHSRERVEALLCGDADAML